MDGSVCEAAGPTQKAALCGCMSLTGAPTLCKGLESHRASGMPAPAGAGFIVHTWKVLESPRRAPESLELGFSLLLPPGPGGGSDSRAQQPIRENNCSGGAPVAGPPALPLSILSPQVPAATLHPVAAHSQAPHQGAAFGGWPWCLPALCAQAPGAPERKLHHAAHSAILPRDDDQVPLSL